MELLHPGVYVQELPSSTRPIEGLSTSTAVFIGKAQMGPLDRAVLLTNPAGFEASFGGFLSDSFLAHSVFQFFNNGGKKCYVVRVAGAGARPAQIALKDRKGAASRTLVIRAANAGAWGNAIDVVITNGVVDPANEFSIAVLRDRSGENPPQPPVLLESLENLSMNPAASNYVEKVVAGRSAVITATVEAANLASAVAGTSRSAALPVGNGAALLGLVAGPGGATETAGTAGPPPTRGRTRSSDGPNTNPPADQRRLAINVDGDGAQDIVISSAAATGPEIAASIQALVRALVANNPARQPALAGFTCVFQTPPAPAAPFYELTSGSTGPGSSVSVTNATAPSISLPAGTKRFVIDIDRDGPHLVDLPAPALANGAAIASAIRTAVRAITPTRASNAGAFAAFDCAYQNGAGAGNPSLLLTSGTPGVASSVRVSNASAGDIARTLGLGATNGGVQVEGGSVLRPANSQTPTEYHLGDAVVAGNVDDTLSGEDGLAPGDTEHKNGLNRLDTLRDINIVTIPGQSSADVVSTGVNYCTQRGDCFFIGDSNASDTDVEAARRFVDGLTVKSSYGAVYYPWLKMTDPTGQAPRPLVVPPSGFVAGMYARIDSRRGVFKAPAGTEANVGGAVGLAADTTDAQQDFLNPIGVNVIRTFPASGIVIWGARTLATRSDPAYRYIPVRRLAIFLEQSILNGIQFAVFEPNDEPLWSSLRLNIGAFMFLQFRAGAFQGRTANEAFFVKVDGTTTTQQDIDAGRVNILVGFAPLKPAEFVVLQLTQKAGQPAT
jgi:uncharacterized protein